MTRGPAVRTSPALGLFDIGSSDARRELRAEQSTVPPSSVPWGRNDRESAPRFRRGQDMSTWLFLLPTLCVLRRLSGLPHLPRRCGSASPTTSTCPASRANWVWFDNYINALNDPLMWNEPVARGAVHPHVPAGNDHSAASARDTGRPGTRRASGDILPRRTADPSGHPQHARLRAVEVDVQLPGRPNNTLPGRHPRPVHRCRTRRSGWAERR